MSIVVAALALGLIAQTDTVIPLEGATLLSLETPGGSIVVSAWERNEIRIQAEHSSRSFIDIDRRGDRIDVEAEARVGTSVIADYRISVPVGLDLDLEGHYTTIEVRGVGGAVTAETQQGSITVVGARGPVEASSLNGPILIEGTEGRVEIDAVASDVRFVNVAGEVVVENVGGDILFEGGRARSVEAGTVGGRIVYDGTIEPRGSYYFGSHGGSVTVRIPQGSGAQVTVATIHGNVRADLPGVDPGPFRRGQRTTFQVGDGSASVEVETFSGAVRFTRERPTMGIGTGARHDGA